MSADTVGADWIGAADWGAVEAGALGVPIELMINTAPSAMTTTEPKMSSVRCDDWDMAASLSEMTQVYPIRNQISTDRHGRVVCDLTFDHGHYQIKIGVEQH